MALHPVFIQTMYYGVVLVLAVGVVGFMQKGFFWKYLRVRLSFGKFVLVKVRGKLVDSFSVGWVEDGFLVYKDNKKDVRLSLEDKNAVYRSLSISWIDVDQGKNAVMGSDYSAAEGFDAKKYNDLYIRALMQPEIGFGKEKLIIVLVIITAVAAAGALYMSYNNAEILRTLGPQISDQVSRLAEIAKGTVVGSSTTI